VTCATGKTNFRLLDANVGWDPDASATVNLTGFDDPAGIYLAQIVDGAVDPNQILPYLPPARLARGCNACEWYLVTPAPPEALLLHRDACQPEWRRVWEGACSPEPFKDPVAVGTWRHRVAVSDRAANRVLIWFPAGTRIFVEINTPTPGPLAFDPCGELLVTSANSPRIARFGPDGGLRGYLKAMLPAQGTVVIIAVDSKRRVWVVLEESGSWLLKRASRDEDQFEQASVVELQNAFAATGLVTAFSAGFCFDEDTRRGLGVTTCYSWYGRPLKEGAVVPPQPPQRQTQGQLITTELDSGIPRCEWHRIRLDADIPAGTTLSVAAATTEDPKAPNQGDASREPPAWRNFPPGPPHFSDWTAATTGSVDFLIDQPAGRYLFFRLRMTGNGTATPVVRRARIDFPRVTSLDYLPAVYRENPKAEDFTSRFLSLFDASIAEVDSVITRYPALLDPTGVPAQLLPWLGGFFDIGFDPTWAADKRRHLLQAAPQHYRLRGTLAGLQLAIQTVFGVTPSIEELSSAGPWGSITGKTALCSTENGAPSSHVSLGRPARLRAVRLFGKTRSRFRLGRSALGGAPLRSYGNPDRDPFAAGAYRFHVLLPPMEDNSSAQRQRLASLIKSQSPAHTVASVRVGGTGFLLGQWSAIGVDTAFVPLAAPVLGNGGNVRLNRMSVLWSGLQGRASGTAVGRGSIVGSQIIAG
jgi:phage tail-like protein